MSKEEIAALRTTLGLTQMAMAQRLGVHLSTFQQWESGRRKPGAAAVTLLRLLKEGGGK